MKSLGLTVSALLLCTTMSFAQVNRNKAGKEPFATNVEKLSKYLELSPAQINEVANINDFFIEKQRESLRSGAKNQEKKMYQAVYGNLKLMKGTLTPEQYRKYVTLLNVTNNNNRVINVNALPDVYLAAKK